MVCRRRRHKPDRHKPDGRMQVHDMQFRHSDRRLQRHHTGLARLLRHWDLARSRRPLGRAPLWRHLGLAHSPRPSDQ
jgi:hypothetical protein